MGNLLAREWELLPLDCLFQNLLLEMEYHRHRWATLWARQSHHRQRLEPVSLEKKFHQMAPPSWGFLFHHLQELEPRSLEKKFHQMAPQSLGFACRHRQELEPRS